MTDEPRPEEAGESATSTIDVSAESSVATEETPAEQPPVKLDQTVELRDIGPCKKHIKVTVARHNIEDRLKDKFNELVKNSLVPGFRPGKAPRKIIEKRFLKDVNDQIKGEILYASLEQLAEEQDIAPLSPPNINPNVIEIPKEGDFVYEFEVEVRPQFELPTYKGLKLRRPIYTITDDDRGQERRRLLQRHGQLVPKPEGKAAIGDVIIADAAFKDGDRVISEHKELQFRVEKQLALKDAVGPKFGEQVAGASPGDKRTVDLTLSSVAADQNLRGKDVKMDLDVKDIKTVRLPDLTPDFLDENFGIRTAEQLDELVNVILDRRQLYIQRQAAREQITSHIAASTNWELPHDLLVRQARKALQRRAMEMQADGMTEQDIESRLRMMQQDIMKSTELALKEHFVLQKIAEVEKIEVNDDDLEAEIERIAAQNDESPRKVRARLEKDDMLDTLAAEMIERKALDLILESAEYEDVMVDQRPDDTGVATSEQQAVPGEMRDLAAEAAEAEKAAATEAEEGAEASS